MRAGLLLVLASLCVALARRSSGANSNVLYEFVTIDYEWESPAQQNYYNNIITGVKVWKSEVYVTVPRWRPGVPSTLNKLVTVGNGTILQPFPSWGMQTIGDPSSLQYVQSMEIDSRGWMWILDVGRRNLLADPTTIVNFAPKLLIWDIENNCTIRTFVFPDSVMPWNDSFANDIVVDETNGYAYMTSTWDQGGVIIYDFNLNLARRFDDSSMNPNATNQFSINGVTYTIPYASDGIALSHDTKTLYYCDLSRTHLWSVPTNLLQDFSLPSAKISQYVVDHGVKGYSDGMAFASNGMLYYGSIAENAVYAWNVSLPLSTATIVAQDSEALQWCDTFAFDGTGNLLFTANRLQLYAFGGMRWDGSAGANFRIWSVPVNAKSYLTGDPVPASLPCALY